MIRFFKSSYLVQYSAILITGLLLWGRAFADPPTMPVPEGFVPFYGLIFFLLDGAPNLQVVLGFLLTAGSALLLNSLLTRHNIVHKNSALTGFIFMVMMSSYPEFQTLHPVNITVFFLLLLLGRLFSSYNSDEPLDILFSAGFLAAIASYIYFPFIFFYLYVISCLIIFRLVKWRAWMSTFLGFLVPFIYLGIYYFWTDKLVPEAIGFASMFRFSFSFATFREPVFATLGILVTLSSVYALSFSLRNRIDKSIERTRKNLAMNWLIIFALVTLPFSSVLSAFHTEILYIPFSGVISYYLMQVKKPGWREIVLILFVLFILLNNLLFRWL